MRGAAVSKCVNKNSQHGRSSGHIGLIFYSNSFVSSYRVYKKAFNPESGRSLLRAAQAEYECSILHWISPRTPWKIIIIDVEDLLCNRTFNSLSCQSTAATGSFFEIFFFLMYRRIPLLISGWMCYDRLHDLDPEELAAFVLQRAVLWAGQPILVSDFSSLNLLQSRVVVQNSFHGDAPPLKVSQSHIISKKRNVLYFYRSFSLIGCVPCTDLVGTHSGIGCSGSSVSLFRTLRVGEKPDAQCISKCNCFTSSISPVCGSNGVTYLSACFAGCTRIGSTKTTSSIAQVLFLWLSFNQ